MMPPTGRPEVGREFLEAIRESPEDDAPRLVYADWLDDHGDPDRAQLLRVQCELARLPRADDRRAELERQEGELLAANRDGWLGPLASVLRHDHCIFRRGFPEDLTLPPRTMVRLAEELDARVPAGRVRLTGHFGEPAMKALVACPHLACVAGLRWEHLFIKESGLDLVAGAANLPHLAELAVGFGRFTRAGVQALADSPHRQALRRLYLHRFGGSERPAAGLVLAAEGLPFRLQGLTLYGTLAEADEAAALAGAAHLAGLRELDLMLNQVGDEGAVALARSPYLRGLSLLNLHLNGLTQRAVRELADSPLLDGIRDLCLGCNDIGDEGAEALAACPRLSRLERLRLFSAHLSDRGAEALAESPHLANLTDLDLMGANTITDRGSQALFDSPHLRRLERISLGRTSPAQRRQWKKRLGAGAGV